MTEERGLHRHPGHPRGDRDALALNPAGAAPPTHDSNTWYNAELDGARKTETQAVSRATSHTPVSVRYPHAYTSRDRAKPAPGRPCSGPSPRHLRHKRRPRCSWDRPGCPGHGTVEGDVVAERGRRLVGHGHTADVQQQGGVERVTNVVLAQIGAPGQRSRDQARAHRHARRQPETHVGDHRETAGGSASRRRWPPAHRRCRRSPPPMLPPTGPAGAVPPSGCSAAHVESGQSVSPGFAWAPWTAAVTVSGSTLRGLPAAGFVRAGDDVVPARHERLEPVAGDVSGIVLVALVGLGALHARAIEELGVCRAGHQRRDRHTGVGDHLTDRLGERLHERLRRRLGGVVRASHRRRHRRREQHTTLEPAGHSRDHRPSPGRYGIPQRLASTQPSGNSGWAG